MAPTIRQLKTDHRTRKQVQDDFLTIFGEVVSVSRAAKKARVHRSTIYDWINKDAAFKIKFEAACQVALGALEDEAVRRAFEGTKKPVYQGGKKVGMLTEYSDTLMIVLLKARAPEKYKERQELTGKNGTPLNQTVVVKMPDGVNLNLPSNTDGEVESIDEG
jgi:hypothetical protein